jgi:hypothetical protein
MSITTSQQLVRFYEAYQGIEVTFNKEVIQFTGLMAKQTYLKTGGLQTPCVVYSTSMTAAKLIANLDARLFERIREASSLLTLRFAFRRPDNPLPLSFFVSGRISGVNRYGKEKRDTYIIAIDYTQKPPDDLIEILGRLLEIRSNMTQRKNERIVLDESSIRKLRIKAKDGDLHIDGKPRKCIIRDLSLTGAKVFSVSLSQSLVKKPVVLTMWFTDQQEPMHMPARIVRFEPIEGREDIAAVAMAFDDNYIPPEYKLKISRYFS